MVRVHGYNKERNDKGFFDLYMMAFFFAIFLVLALVIGGKGFIFLAKFFIAQWVWALGLVLAIVFVGRFLRRKKH